MHILLLVCSWDGVESMINHATQDWLCVDLQDSPVLLVEPPIVKHSRREK